MSKHEFFPALEPTVVYVVRERRIYCLHNEPPKKQPPNANEHVWSPDGYMVSFSWDLFEKLFGFSLPEYGGPVKMTLLMTGCEPIVAKQEETANAH